MLRVRDVLTISRGVCARPKKFFRVCFRGGTGRKQVTIVCSVGCVHEAVGAAVGNEVRPRGKFEELYHTGWFKLIAPNPVSVQRPRRL